MSIIPMGQLWKASRKTYDEFRSALGNNSSDLDELHNYLKKHRASCEPVSVIDLDSVSNKVLEEQLWDAHGELNKKFRRHLRTFRAGEGKKKVVEQRKALKSYLDFIKSSQRFYRNYIHQLNVQYGGIPELETVAERFNPNDAQVNVWSEISAELRIRVLESCHQTLIQLGDLSRYRETEMVSKDRNWGPAIGYYDLANKLRPFSGASHHQMAAIAKIDGNNLRSTYHLYRALVVTEPHPNAQSNLELDFEKVLDAWEPSESINNGLERQGRTSRKSLSDWFVRLHAKCYKGVDFPEHDELENEILSQLALDLKERSLEGTLEKFTLINIAAEYFAGQRAIGADTEKPRDASKVANAKQSYLFFQRLNVRSFFALLQILQPELERFAMEDDYTSSDNSSNSDMSDRVTAVARRVLPALRNYSSWLKSNVQMLIAEIGETSVTIQMKELWKIYATTLTLFVATFQVSGLPEIPYLLIEDEDTLGFKPFEDQHDQSQNSRYYDQDTGLAKPSFSQHGVERCHPNQEMLGRIRDFLAEGMRLAVDTGIDVPIDLDQVNGTFMFREEGMPSQLLSSPEPQYARLSSTDIAREEISYPAVSNAASIIDDRGSLSASASVSANPAMKRMVDELVGSEATYDADLPDISCNYDEVPRAPPTPPSHSFDDDSPFGKTNDETSYGLLGNDSAYDPMDEDSPDHPQLSTPRFSTLYTYPMASYHGEPASSRPNTATRLSFPQQQPDDCGARSNVASVHSPPYPSSILSATAAPYETYGHGHLTLPESIATKYGPNGEASTIWGNGGSTFDNSHFISPLMFDESLKAFNGRTPPNGQAGG